MKSQITFLLICGLLFFVGCDGPQLLVEQQLEPLNPSNSEEAVFLQEIAASSLNLPSETAVLLDGGVYMKFVLIPAGELYMGSPYNELGRDSDEGPRHSVKITKPYYMGKFEVTQLQYRTIMGKKKCKFHSDGLPVENVNWYEVNSFLSALCHYYAYTFRLPTEAEWEYACRAGTTTPFYTGNTISSDQANYDSRDIYGSGKPGVYLKMTNRGGKYPPNAFGLYDMHGNVWEWCSDFYISNYYKRNENIDPKGPLSAGGHVIRGGSWQDSPVAIRSASRKGKGEGADKKYLGFRVALEIPESSEKYFGAVIGPLDRQIAVPEKIVSPGKIISTEPMEKIEHKLIYDEKTRRGYISVKGKGLEARSWILSKIGEICSSKNILLKKGSKPEPAYYRLLDEKLEDGVYTIEFEVVR